jgi:hypothetical protein
VVAVATAALDGGVQRDDLAATAEALALAAVDFCGLAG